MLKRLIIFLVCVVAVAFYAFSQNKSSAMKKAAAPAPPDRAYIQKIWDGWATLNPDNVAQYYAPGPNTFFDIAPLKYASWDDYEKGVKLVLAGYKSATFRVNDDLAIHPRGDLAWVTATVADEMTQKAGKVEMGNMRWTAVFENQNGKWLIVHEHVSAPIQ